MAKTRVVVVDDSALVRSLLTEIVNRQSDMECIGSAADPFAARETIRNLNPDVITLDVEMPRMNGLEFLEKLMRLRPTPVVMISTLTERGAQATMQAQAPSRADGALASSGSVQFVTVGEAEASSPTAIDAALTSQLSAAMSQAVPLRILVVSGGIRTPE